MHILTLEQMKLRAARCAVRDHALRDPLEEDLYEEIIGQASLYGVWTRDDVLEMRLDEVKTRREMNAEDQPRRSVAQALSDCEVLGLSSHFETAHFRRGAVVIRVRYATTYVADYEISPIADEPAYCWQD